MEMSGLTRWLRWSGAGVAVGLAALLLQPARADAGSPLVLKAELAGEINTVTAGYIEQARKPGESEPTAAIVLGMKTP